MFTQVQIALGTFIISLCFLLVKLYIQLQLQSKTGNFQLHLKKHESVFAGMSK